MQIAVIGAGISGLAAAFRLQDRHSVTVLEAADYAGGHTHTHDLEIEGRRVAVDSGFIVFNRPTYPLFNALLDELGVASQPTDMSFGVRWDRQRLEYSGRGLGGLFAHWRNAARPVFWRLVADWIRFQRQARRLLPELDERLTVGEFFARHRYSAAFRQGYFLPLGSAVWSSPRAAFEGFPMQSVLEFYRNHGMLGLPGRLPWRVIGGGSQTYVRALVSRLRGGVRLNAAVSAVRRSAGGMEVHTAGKPPERFDHVVFACHSDQALRMLGDQATPREREILSAFPYQRNSAVLHTDASILPRSRRAWASWNYCVTDDGDQGACVTYDMTRLQRLPVDRPVLVTLNADHAIDPARVLRRMTYHHPVFNAGRLAAQRRHAELIGQAGASYCGAYWGHGFHEDGVRSAAAVSAKLNALAGPSVTERNTLAAGEAVAHA